MSDPKQLIPHLRSINVAIPDTWTPDQALAVFELIDELREKIFTLYRYPIKDLLQEQQGCLQLYENDTPATDNPF